MKSESIQGARVGIPYRTRNEELKGDRAKIQPYANAVSHAGGKPIEISLACMSEELERMVQSLDAFVLPGSPADIEPAKFGALRHPESSPADPDRERTDFWLLEHAFGEQKPILAICYGIQSLNVFLGGTLVQDIPSELDTTIQHQREHDVPGSPDPFHAVRIDSGSRLGQMAGASEVQVNSSHHQAILKPGRNLRVVARATDGVIEAVEGAGDTPWVVGVQWHPERMAATDRLAQSLFRALVCAARKTPAHLESLHGQD